MGDGLTLSIFTIEVDRKPLFAVQCKKHSEAEAILTDQTIRDQLSLAQSAGKPVCDHWSIYRVRMARQDERRKFFENESSLLTSDGRLAVFLIDLDRF